MSDLLWDDPTWKRLKGWPCVVMGNSPALNHVDLSLLDPFFTIGVNRILRIYSPDAVLTVDVPVMKQESERFQAHPGKIFMWEGMRKHRHVAKIDLPNSLYFDLASSKQTKDWKFPEKGDRSPLRVGTTPPYAFQLAVLAGCNPIGVLGVDHTANPKNRKSNDTHFYGNGNKLGATGGGQFKGRNQRFWTDAKAWAKKMGVECFNLTPFDDSPFNDSGWDRISLEEFHSRFSAES